jgi:hypothetical protein
MRTVAGEATRSAASVFRMTVKDTSTVTEPPLALVTGTSAPYVPAAKAPGFAERVSTPAAYDAVSHPPGPLYVTVPMETTPRVEKVPGPVLLKLMVVGAGIPPPSEVLKLAVVAEAVRTGDPTFNVTRMESAPPDTLTTGTVAMWLPAGKAPTPTERLTVLSAREEISQPEGPL